MLRYEDMPVIEQNRMAGPSPAVETWQNTHEPMVTLRVWLGPKNGMVAARWSAEVLEEQPVMEMGQAVILLDRAIHQLGEMMLAQTALPAALADMTES